MSDPVTCEHCGRPGRRRLGHVAPEDWYFGMFTLAPDGDHDPGDVLIVLACSEACREGLWTKMAGHKWDAIERRIDVTSELRRAATALASKLRREAARLKDSLWPSTDNRQCAAARWAAHLSDVASEVERRVEAEIEAGDAAAADVPHASEVSRG